MKEQKKKETITFDFLSGLTDEERRYVALEPLNPSHESMSFRSKINLWYTDLTAFFDGDTIVKVIIKMKRVLDDGCVNYESYTEYDTRLKTEGRTVLLPLSEKGKPKKLTMSAITNINPFGCKFSIIREKQRATAIYLSNPRANKEFPIGEWDAIAKISCEDDFHAFMKSYISTCRDNYFDKLKELASAKKVTIKYKAGDIFRIEFDRTRYRYGIITGDIKRIKALPALPKIHSLRQLMTVPIMVRKYMILTEKDDLKADDLRDIPLESVEICSDNDIIWGAHTIVGHKEITEDDIDFNFVCTKLLSASSHTTLFTADRLMHDGIIPSAEYTLYIEWGFTKTALSYDRLSDKLKEYLKDYFSPHGGVHIKIDPQSAFTDESYKSHYNYRKDLLNPENRDFLNEIFACLGIAPDTDFDSFAKAFGGLTRKEIAKLIGAC